MFLCPAPPTSPDRRPSGKRLKDAPPSSLDCSSRWCCSLFRPAKRKDVCRIERPFARTLNGQTPPRYSPLDSGSPRNNLGLARSPFVLRTFPPRAGETRRLSEGGRPPSGLLSLAEPAYAPRPSPAATTVLMTGFRQRFVRPYRRLSRLVAGTAGGSCVGDPVSSRSLPVYLIQLSFSASRPKVARAPAAAMFRFSGAPFR